MEWVIYNVICALKNDYSGRCMWCCYFTWTHRYVTLFICLREQDRSFKKASYICNCIGENLPCHLQLHFLVALWRPKITPICSWQTLLASFQGCGIYLAIKSASVYFFFSMAVSQFLESDVRRAFTWEYFLIITMVTSLLSPTVYCITWPPCKITWPLYTVSH